MGRSAVGFRSISSPPVMLEARLPLHVSGVQWYDSNGKMRIGAGTNADGDASILWFDSDGKRRINAMTRPDGTVILPNSESK